MDIQLAHTADVPPDQLDATFALLEVVFAGDISADDWEHALGGMHAFAWEDGEMVGHASVVQRRLVHGGRALRAGYVEGVGVRPDRQRRGHGAALMREIERVIRGAYVIGALGATDEAVPMYTALGWRRWEGRLSALTPSGIVATPDEEGAVYVLPGSAELDLRGELTCDWRDADCW
jgi:aminoglycoside 2'-N-acetyltransferase I